MNFRDMMKRSTLVLGLALLAVAATSCKKEEALLCNDPFHAYMEQADNKTHLVSDNNLSLRWDEAGTESIKIYAEQTAPNNTHYYRTETYTNSETTPGGVHTVFDITAGGTCLEGTSFVAFYPANFCVTTRGEAQEISRRWVWNDNVEHRTHYGVEQVRRPTWGGQWSDWTNASEAEGNSKWGHYESETAVSEMVSQLSIPSSQQYNDLSMRNAPMRGEAGMDRNLQFYNLCGGLDLYLKEDNINVVRIEIISEEQQLSGTFDIHAPEDYEGTADLNTNHHYIETQDINTWTGTNQDDNHINLMCTDNDHPNGVDITNGENFHISMPIGQYRTFDIIIYTDDGQCAVRKMTLDEGHTFDIQRSTFSKIAFHEGELPFKDIPGIVPGIYSVSPNHHVYFAHGNLWYAPYLGSPWANEPGVNLNTADTNEFKWYIAYEQFDNFAYGSDPYGYNDASNVNSQKYLDGSETYVNPYNWYGEIAPNVNTAYHTGTEDTPKQGNMWELYCWSNGDKDRFGRSIVTSTNRNSCLYGGSYTDWGTNAIYNGTSVPNQWRTLTGGADGEWHYLLMERSVTNHNATAFTGTAFNNTPIIGGENGARYALVMVAGVPGILFFPDDFTWPAGVPKPKYINTITKSANTYIDWTNDASNDVPNYTFKRAVRGDDVDYDLNDPDCPLSMNNEFRRLELAGFVFLPCVGQRVGADIRYCGGLDNPTTHTDGSGWGQTIRYYSASPAGDDKAYYLGVKLSGTDRMDIIAGDVADNSDGNTSNNRYWGRAIRLVMDAD